MFWLGRNKKRITKNELRIKIKSKIKEKKDFGFNS